MVAPSSSHHPDLFEWIDDPGRQILHQTDPDRDVRIHRRGLRRARRRSDSQAKGNPHGDESLEHVENPPCDEHPWYQQAIRRAEGARPLGRGEGRILPATGPGARERGARLLTDPDETLGEGGAARLWRRRPDAYGISAAGPRRIRHRGRNAEILSGQAGQV